jgi:catechol 2,3-dioxygenase-like lactoylglutathione lyase family enzyme
MELLNQVYLLTTDLDRAREFYEDALALSPSRVGDSSVAYRTGDCELKIQADHEPETLDAFNLEQPPDDGRGAGAVYVLAVADPIEEVHDRAAAALEAGAARVLTQPREVEWGGRMFLVESPDGYVFEIREQESQD